MRVSIPKKQRKINVCGGSTECLLKGDAFLVNAKETKANNTKFTTK